MTAQSRNSNHNLLRFRRRKMLCAAQERQDTYRMGLESSRLEANMELANAPVLDRPHSCLSLVDAVGELAVGGAARADTTSQVPASSTTIVLVQYIRTQMSERTIVYVSAATSEHTRTGTDPCACWGVCRTLRVEDNTSHQQLLWSSPGSRDLESHSLWLERTRRTHGFASSWRTRRVPYTKDERTRKIPKSQVVGGLCGPQPPNCSDKQREREPPEA